MIYFVNLTHLGRNSNKKIVALENDFSYSIQSRKYDIILKCVCMRFIYATCMGKITKYWVCQTIRHIK